MTVESTPSESELGQQIGAWLQAFEAALQEGDGSAASALFVADGHWRDLVAISWNIQTEDGVKAIAESFARHVPAARPRKFQLAPGRMAPRWALRAGRDTLEALISFETNTGPCEGVLRLVADPAVTGSLKAWILLTALRDINGYEQSVGAHRPGGEETSRDFGGDNWLDLRVQAQSYANREPQVLVIGGSQCGLGIAAALGQVGVDTLVVDRHERVGDAWRKRYRSLTLHNQVYICHMPYMPFPPNWPVYIPKDKLANWFESYADAMELNVWGGTELVSGKYDENDGRWEMSLRQKSGETLTVRPKHIVFATGVSSIPVRPELPGLDDFAGDVLHSAEYLEGRQWKGKKALVLGTGNSGHDVAQDLHASGVGVTLIQRSSSLIVSLAQAQTVYNMYQEGPSLEDCDLLATAMPYQPLCKAYQTGAAAMKAADKALLEGLEARGFKLDYGPPDDTGYQMKYLRRGGGYYFNVGCSDLVVSGEVGLLHYDQIDRFVAEGARLKDGTVVPADLLVTATGYLNQQDVVRTYLGDGVADRIGQVWGFNEGGELHNMWCRTPQPGLWFTAGGLPHVRIYSKYLAFQIKACEEGLLNADLSAESSAENARQSDMVDAG